jgi:hypothetical protein
MHAEYLPNTLQRKHIYEIAKKIPRQHLEGNIFSSSKIKTNKSHS